TSGPAAALAQNILNRGWDSASLSTAIASVFLDKDTPVAIATGCFLAPDVLMTVATLREGQQLFVHDPVTNGRRAATCVAVDAAHQLAAVRLVPAEGQATTERTVLRNEAQRAERATRVTMVQRSERGRLIVRSASISGEKTRNRNSRVDLL